MNLITTRGIIGMILVGIDAPMLPWVNDIAMEFNSDQDIETYAWLGNSPQMREWIGGRQAKGLRENNIKIANKKFESTIEIPVEWRERDKTGQIQMRISELAMVAATHWADLLSTLVEAGESTVCYDGQYFYDTDHSEGSSGTQSNSISVDISTLAVSQHGSTTAPSVGEMQQAILLGIQQLVGFKNDQGKPMNEYCRKFTVKVPISLWMTAVAAIGASNIDNGASNIIANGALEGFSISIVPNVRLTWTTKIAVFCGDGAAKALIKQKEKDITVKAIAEGSELEFNESVHHFGVDARRNVGYGYWQKSCLVTLI